MTDDEKLTLLATVEDSSWEAMQGLQSNPPQMDDYKDVMEVTDAVLLFVKNIERCQRIRANIPQYQVLDVEYVEEE